MYGGMDRLHQLSYQLRGNRKLLIFRSAKDQARFDTRVHPMDAKPGRFAYMANFLVK